MLKDIPDVEPDINSDYVVISPFSKGKYRIYSADNYVKIIDFITDKYNMPVIIIGGNHEICRAQYIKDLCKKQDLVYNMAGKPLSESILYIRRARLLVANETGTVHIAQNYNVKTVCISNGSYMGTFQPYPKEESYVFYVYPDNIFEYIREHNAEGHSIEYDINKIEADKVNSVIEKVLQNGVSDYLAV